MIGRGAIGKPWIFKEIRHYLDTGEHLPPLTVTERVELTHMHLLKSIENKGEKYGVLEMRQHFSNYFKGLPNFKETRLKLVTAPTYDEVVEILNHIKQEWGDMPLQNNHLVDNCCKKLENL